ncbi:palmitoyltransferase ZDHHC7 [Biomphalaria glabrata]
MSAILHDETAVEHVKKEGHVRVRKSRLTLLQEVFGRSHPILWLWPFQMDRPKDTSDAILYNI